MEERYLRQVKRVLCLPGKRKEEVLRDLREAFASAKENGEPAEAVIERLGSPEDFAGGIHEQLGIDAAAKRRRRDAFAGAMLLLLAAAAWLVLWLSRALRPAENVIGQADAMTSIQVSGSSAVPLLLGLAAAVLVVGGALLLARGLRARRR